MPSLVGVAALVAAALCGGAWGWRVGTKRVYRRSVFDDDEARGSRGRRRRLRQRYWTTFLYALVSALAVLVLMTLTQR